MNKRPNRPNSQPVSIDTIVDGLKGRIYELCETLLPGGRRDGHEWRAGSIAGEKGKSLGVHLTGSKAGVWSDFAAGEGGDALDLVATCLFGGDKKQAIAWAKDWLGYAGTSAHRDDRLAETRRRAAAKKSEAKDEPAPAEKRGHAQKLWLSGQADIIGTPVEDYLKGRGVDLRRLDRLPGALRYHPRCKESETQSYIPAMLAAVYDKQGFLTVHRTYLKILPGGRAVKADLKAAKKVYSTYRGGTIRIARGASNKPLAKMPEGEPIYLTEGIEDALTIAQEAPEWRVMAVIALGNLASIDLPPQCGPVVICADNDEGNPKAIQALDRACQSLLQRGVQVEIAHPPQGFKDWNDYLLNKRGANDRQAR